MRGPLLDLICCPGCLGRLRLHPFTAEEDHVMEGALACLGCGAVYLVVGGVPRLLPRSLYWDAAFADRFGTELAAVGAPPGQDHEVVPGADLKRATAAAYGFEWNTWSRFGWEPGGQFDAGPEVFRTKSLLAPNDLAGRVVVDAGCGNGRYSAAAARHAAQVIAIDLSTAVDAAFTNLRDLPGAHVVQGDLTRPPLPRDSVDRIFSIGVLMITGDARRTTEILAGRLRPDGTITAHVYARGFPLWQLDDAVVRSVTTRLPIGAVTRLATGMTRAAKALDRRGWLGYSSLVLRVWPDDAVNFDWYATPRQTYHTYPEVVGWFTDMGYEVVATNERPPPPPGRTARERLSRWVWRDAMVTVKARRPA
ncbi:MAG TPA: methyltransferase domain-containing protein [Acidimicrobiales bacterium]|nr:methyltransferase domain-containing protein [Acidimicrobiales bacterium]